MVLVHAGSSVDEGTPSYRKEKGGFCSTSDMDRIVGGGLADAVPARRGFHGASAAAAAMAALALSMLRRLSPGLGWSVSSLVGLVVGSLECVIELLFLQFWVDW
ncbi:hypothetical protein GCM10009818_20280 [Nakamurella flavida]